MAVGWQTLARLLGGLQRVHVDEAPVDALSLPHERALARAVGVPAQDGLAAGAAWLAAQRGLGAPGQGWARLTPTHWAAGSDQVELRGPESLQLSAEEEADIFAALGSVFDSAGYALHFASPGCWLIQHDSLRELPTLSLDRVIGRPLETWLRPDPAARALRRLQSEAQMLLHTHPVNAQRETRGQWTVNSVWISDSGALPAALPALQEAPLLCDALRLPALQGDWEAWVAAWAALQAGPLTDAQARLQSGGAVTLTLCGERAAVTFSNRPEMPWWQRTVHRFRPVNLPALLETL